MRPRANGRAVQGDGDSRPALAGAGRVRPLTVACRDATHADAPAIADLFAQSFTRTFGHLYRPEDLQAFLATMTAERLLKELGDPRFHFRLADDGGELAGYIKLGPPDLPVDAPPGTIQLYQLYVLDRWHGSGIAKTLMGWALAKAGEQRARHIQLSVYIDNHRARRFYERYGFTEIGRYRFMVGDHADEDIVLRHTLMDVAA